MLVRLWSDPSAMVKVLYIASVTSFKVRSRETEVAENEEISCTSLQEATQDACDRQLHGW